MYPLSNHMRSIHNPFSPQDSSDDGMIAAYLQSLEQEKAFQQQQRYTSPLNQGAMGMYPPGTLPPRQPYPGTYKYTY